MGQPKMWLPFGDEVMLQRLTRIMRQVTQPVAVVAAEDQELPELHPETLVCRDEFPDKGPLSGIYTGLKLLHENGVESAFVTACDCPFLKPEFVRFLADRFTPDFDSVLLTDGKYHYVLSAIFRTKLYDSAKRLLDHNQLRPIKLCDASSSLVLDIDAARISDPQLESLMNLNSPEDYEAALQKLNCENNHTNP